MAYEKEYLFAQRIAKSVGNFAAREQKKGIKKELKEDQSFVTETDVAVEKKIIAAIKKQYPLDNILSEEIENANTLKRDRLWIIDPIDGTHPFAAGEDNYCIIIGCMDHNEMQFGVLYQPNKKRMITAQRGKGAWCNGERLMPMQETDLKKVIVCSALWYFTKNNKLKEGLPIYKRVLENCLDIMRYGSCGLDMYRVAAGKIGAYYEYGLKPWDVAAASIIVQETGGIVTKPDGSPLDIFQRKDNKWYVELLTSANAALHKRMVELLTSKYHKV